MAKQKVYIVAKYFAKPRNRRLSASPGNMKDDSNVQWDEQVQVVNKIKPADAATAKIILNITEQKVEKNSFQNGRSFMELFGYFYETSTKEIADGLRQYGVVIEKGEDGNQGNVPENQAADVSGEAEAGARSEPATAGEPV